MDNDYRTHFDTLAEDDVRYGDEDYDQGDTDNSKLMYLSGIAKALIDIRDELRRLNDAK